MGKIKRTYINWHSFSINEGLVPNIHINLKDKIFYLRLKNHRFIAQKGKKFIHETDFPNANN